MKKRSLNKIIIFTLFCIISCTTITNAKITKESYNSKTSSVCSIDPHPYDPQPTR